MNSHAIGIVWFSGRSTVGIVVAYDQIEERPKAWISAVEGEDEKQDIQMIMDWGSKFPISEAKSLVETCGTVLDRELWSKISVP